MERYSEYKGSGIFWAPEIPSNWNIRRLGHILQKENRKRPQNAELLVCTNKATVIKRGNSKMGLVAESEEVYQGVRQGDLLIHGMDTWHGAIAISEFDGMCTPVVHVCTSNESVGYISFYLRYMAYMKVFKLISNGVRQNTSDFRSWAKVSVIPILLPPLSEQQFIVSYLNSKCEKIDKMIEGKEKQIALLQELKQRTIADAVTRGLNPDVKMKATNISWLEEIPEHWRLDTLRKFLRIVSVKDQPDKPLLSVTREQGVIVRNIDSKEENHNYIPNDLSGYKYVEIGDFCINKMKSWQGSYGVSKYEGIVSPAYYICKLKGVDKEFFNTAIRSKCYVCFFAQYSKGIRVDQWDLSPIGLKSIPFFLPPITEQRAIVSYINERTEKIDTLTSKLQQEIESIKEYKQRLISDVVTGQIKVC